jgi:hypothetical protein
MSESVAARLTELQDNVRFEAGHRRPSQKTLVSALIWAAEQDGRKLEVETIAPYRLDHDDED